MTTPALQTSVNFQQGFGLVGEFAAYSPQRVQSALLNSASAANNVFGNAFSYSSAASSNVTPGVVTAGGTGVFAGLMVSPKEHPLFGDGTDPLNPSLVLPNNVISEFCTMGFVIITFTKATTPNLGDYLEYNNTTGALQAINAGSSLDSGFSFAFGVLDMFQPVLITGTTYQGVAQLTPSLTHP